MATPISNLSATWTETSQTYNAIGMNVNTTGHADGSTILNLKKNDETKFAVDIDGNIFVGGNITSANGSSGNISVATITSSNLISTYYLTSNNITANTVTLLDNAIVTVNDVGTVTPTMLSQNFTQGTAVDMTSKLSTDFLNIPSWVRRITVMTYGLYCTSGSPEIRVLVGTNGVFETSGYTTQGWFFDPGGQTVREYYPSISSSGFDTYWGGMTPYDGVYGMVTLYNVNANSWLARAEFIDLNWPNWFYGFTAKKSMSAALNCIRITNDSGLNYFGGTVNIFYE